jgi:F-type H+-transporting ATPase subunit b
MPQLDTQFLISQMFWLLASFIFIYTFVSTYFFPRISQIVEGRKQKTKQSISQADALHVKQQHIKTKIENLLTTARTEALSIKQSSTKKADDELNATLSKLEKDLAKKISTEEQKLFKVNSAMLLEINEVASSLSDEILTMIKKTLNIKSENLN